MIVCTDADNLSVDERMQNLKKELQRNQINWKGSKEPIIFFIPKRQIETWIRLLRGEDVDEEMTFHHSGNPISCKKEARAFSEFCQDIKDIDCSKVKSLLVAKKEYIRVCELQ